MRQINQGISPQGQTINQSISITIEPGSQGLDESFVRQRLVPTIKDELRNASLKGEFILSQRGVRTA
jgi:hypothetical protein